jgi:hypothetical protein
VLACSYPARRAVQLGVREGVNVGTDESVTRVAERYLANTQEDAETLQREMLKLYARCAAADGPRSVAVLRLPVKAGEREDETWKVQIDGEKFVGEHATDLSQAIEKAIANANKV